MLVEVLLHQVAERDRAEGNSAIGNADELPAGPRKSLHEWYKELTVNLAMGGDSDEEPDTKGNMRGSQKSLFWCRRIISYTSYSRTNDCTYNGYVNDNLEHNTMINIDTVAHMNMHYTQS